MNGKIDRSVSRSMGRWSGAFLFIGLLVGAGAIFLMKSMQISENEAVYLGIFYLSVCFMFFCAFLYLIFDLIFAEKAKRYENIVYKIKKLRDILRFSEREFDNFLKERKAIIKLDNDEEFSLQGAVFDTNEVREKIKERIKELWQAKTPRSYLFWKKRILRK